MFTSIIVVKWFIGFFSILALVCLRWGIREMKRTGNKMILRTCLLLFVLFASIATLLIVNFHNERYSGYSPSLINEHTQP